MKKKIKALLIMLVLIMPFVTANVYAEELPETKLQEPQQEVQENTWTLEKFMELFKDVTLDIKESEAFNTSDNYYNFYDFTKTENMIKEQFNKILADNAITLPLTFSEEKGNITINDIYTYLSDDIHKVNISFNQTCKPVDDDYSYCNNLISTLRKTINVNYNNTKDYDEEIAKYVENKLNSIPSKILYGENIDTYNGCNLDDEIIKKEFVNLQRALNDDSITLMFVSEGGGCGYDGNSSSGPLIAVKDNIVYASKVFSIGKSLKVIIPDNINDTDEAYIAYALPKVKEYFSKMDADAIANQIVKIEKINSDNNDYPLYASKNLYSIIYNDGDSNPIFLQKENAVKVTDNVTIEGNSEVTLSGTQITKEDKIYSDLAGAMASKGYTNVFGAYELKIEEGSIGENGLTLTFNVGNEHNGKQAYVLHQKHDGSYEEFSGIVENGVIKIVVNELSPFMIALGDKVEETTNNAGTGTTNIALYGTIAVIALGGMAYTIKKKNN